MSGFGAKSTTDEVLAGHDLTGMTVFITGGASGLGQETARAMAAKGAHVVLAARDQSKLDAAATEIRKQTGSDKVDTIQCDLASLASVRVCGKEANERFDKIDLLLNNAGVMACPLGRTADGFELQFGTNHLGHFVLTKYLLPLVEEGSGKRIVNLSSRAHHMDQVHFDDPNYASRDYEKWQSYGQSKTANVLFTVALDKRLKGKGIDVFAVHPGGIMTNLGRHLTEEDRAALQARVTQADQSFSWKTVEQGAATSCWAATAPELAGHGGVYCEDCQVAAVDDASSTGGVRSYAVDPDKAERLWTLSEELVGETFAV
ncbi:SDR family NAD(P)-dependent oxidoreductase [Altererythrobacter litoralis]|uniref:SDR family NAD(P)-dependent oxidoreductase n=1 Tax=Altererythrobacter litoralis TaxID=3113904 RepID=A0ABU7GGX2_9SPHN|nr:SDR family NAD(P)-dependent oxidoreductase [Erythrobacteraceae bacterium 1XM1-14]